MLRSLSRGNKGQAAALDLAIFVSICILALSFLFIQSIRSSAATGFIEENENINEVAVKAIDSLAQSAVEGLELKVVQPVAMEPVESCLSEEVRLIMGYADKALDALEDIEDTLRTGELPEDNPAAAYFTKRLENLSDYVISIVNLSGIVEGVISSAIAEGNIVCDALESLSGLLPGYGDLSCGSLVSDFLDGFFDNITSSVDSTSLLEDLLDYLEFDEVSEEVIDTIHELRCSLQGIKDFANTFITYLEVGVSLKTSFMEMWPVEADVKVMTVEQFLSDALTVRDALASADDLRSTAGMVGLFLLRSENMGEHLPNLGITNNTETYEETLREETILLRPKRPLRRVTNSSAKGFYRSRVKFHVESYLTQSSALAVRLMFEGRGYTPKHSTKYFEKAKYILNSSSYPGSSHYRTYNSTGVKGTVTESPVTITKTEWFETINSTSINTTTKVMREVILRPMKAKASFVYEGNAWPEKTYTFDIEHICVTRDSNHTIIRRCRGYNESDALKSIVLGIILTGRDSLISKAEEVLEERLDDLLEGYSYKFEVKDCCSTVIEINAEEEPSERQGISKYYFIAGDDIAEMILTVWR